jgi:hypothetical protein
MKTTFNLLLSILISSGLKAQTQNNMENRHNAMAKGQVIKHGKIVYSEIRINASPEKVWKEFTDFESYPTWNPFIKSLKGKPSVGNKVEAQIHAPGKKAMLFKPKVLVFDSLQEFRWIGKLFIPRLFDGEHTFMIKDNNDGTTTFIQYERFRGILIPLTKKMLDENTLDGFNQMNSALKARCEK